MSTHHNPDLTPNAQTLRRTMTRQERHLWYDFLKTLPITIHRQKVIGPYIVDFYCAAAQIVIELDGSQHYTPAHRWADSQRDNYLQSLGLTVLRYTNLEMDRQFSAVCEQIWLYISNRLHLPD